MPLVRPPANRPIRVKPVGVSGIQTDRNTSGAASAVVSDTFTRADSAVALGTADTGQVWSSLGGTEGIQSNQAYVAVDGGGNNNVAVIDSGLANGSVQMTLAVADSSARLVWRATDVSNFFMADTVSGARYDLYRRETGTFNLLDAAAVVPANGDILKAVLTATGFEFWVNGVLQKTIVDAFQTTATKHGIGFAAVNTARIDNFSVSA